MKIIVGLVFIGSWPLQDFIWDRYALSEDEHILGTDIRLRLHEDAYWMVLE